MGSTILFMRVRGIVHCAGPGRSHPRMSRFHFAAVLAVILAVVAMPGAEVGVTDGPKGVVVNPRNGKAYAAFPDLGS